MSNIFLMSEEFALRSNCRSGLGCEGKMKTFAQLLLVLVACICVESSRRSVSKPNIADKALPILRSSELNRMFGRDSGKGKKQILAVENVQYKCQILTALYTYWRANFRESQEKAKIGARLNNLLKECNNPNFRVSDFFNQTVIFPGTKWCGQTNIAENFEELGMFNETDKCCRDHDFCDDIIQAGRTKHNLINPYSTTRLNCRCDEEMRKCFQDINSVISNTVGYIFFSMLQTQCFKLEYPATGCQLWRRGSVRLYCVKYELDESQPKKWQWFDQEPYF